MGPIADGSPQNEREGLEEQLLAAIQVAYKAYREAAEEHSRIRAQYGNMFDHPDSMSGLHKAAADERIALQNYSRALKAFSNLVVPGRAPSPREDNPESN